MDIGSYAHTIDILHFDFIQSTPVEFYREIELTSFELKDFYAEKRNETFSTGTFPAVQIIFQLKRYVSFYISQVKQPESYRFDKMLELILTLPRTNMRKVTGTAHIVKCI